MMLCCPQPLIFEKYSNSNQHLMEIAHGPLGNVGNREVGEEIIILLQMLKLSRQGVNNCND